MIYEVITHMFFAVEDEAKDYFHDCEVALPKAIVVNPHSENQECSEVTLADCYHDEDPHHPCVVTAHDDNCPLQP